MNASAPGMLLVGPDAANPLGFLTALGTLRVATLVWPDRDARLSWSPHGAGWRPVLHVHPAADTEALVRNLHAYCRYGRTFSAPDQAGEPTADEAFPWFALDKNTSKVEPQRFAGWASAAAQAASPADRRYADFLAAIGCEACIDDDYVEDTAFRTMSGSGHQDFLVTMLNLVKAVTPEHIRSALLEPWRYQDPLATFSMRWDPADLKQYALQWGNPSSDPTRGKRGSMLGANRLAVEALPYFPTLPERRPSGRVRARTTGFEPAPSEPRWTWPIWEDPVGIETCASLLRDRRLQDLGTMSPQAWRRRRSMRQSERVSEAARGELRRMGVVEVFRSRRLSVDYYRNFTHGRAL